MNKRMKLILQLALLGMLLTTIGCAAKPAPPHKNITQAQVGQIVAASVEPLMQQYEVPGVAVALTLNGKRYFCNYGVASRETQRPIDEQTIFEIGSVSKTFTATLASYASVTGRLKLDDPVGKYEPTLSDSAFGRISLLILATHTSGGLPLQLPDWVEDDTQLLAYLKTWQPAHETGAYRSYSNISIGLLGRIAAQQLALPFAAALEETLLKPLGMTRTYLRVPNEQQSAYAQGYNRQNVPVRLNGGELSAEAYGLKSCSADLCRWLEANMRIGETDAKLQAAIDGTQVGYYQAGVMTQGLIWEQYAWPTTASELLQGNSETMILNDTAVVKIEPPRAPQTSVLVNKTGSTNGFSTYLVFLPGEQIGIVLLANKSFPIGERVKTIHQILQRLQQLKDAA